MLTPIDIQNHVLKTTMGGYNKKETDDFIESVQESYEQLYKENHDLKEKITALSEGLQYYKQMEGTLQKALVLAEKTSTETLEAAQTQATTIEQESKEKADTLIAEAQEQADITLTEAQEKADAILADANQRAASVLSETKNSANALLAETKSITDSMLSEANRQLSETSSAVKKLIHSYDDYKEQFKTIVSSQLTQLNSSDFQIYVPDLDQLLQAQKLSIAASQDEILNKIEDMVSNADALEFPAEEELPAEHDDEYTETMSATEEFAEQTVSEEAVAATDELSETLSSESESAFGADLSFGITGNTDTAAAEETTDTAEASSTLFTTDSDFGAAGAGAGNEDGFAVGSDSSDPSDNTPFTFIDAN